MIPVYYSNKIMNLCKIKKQKTEHGNSNET